MTNYGNDNDRLVYDVMPLKDKLFLSPTEKYTIYGRFPWKMIISIFLVFATTSQILIVMGGTSSYARAGELFFHDQFVKAVEDNNIEYAKKNYLYSIDEVIAHVNKSIYNYYSLKEISLEYLTYPVPLSDTKIFLEFFFMNQYYDREKQRNELMTYENSFILNKDNLGPFNPESEEYADKGKLRNMLRLTKFFQMNYTLFSYVPFSFADHYKCFFWEIKQIYSFEQRSHFTVSLDVKRNICLEQIVSFDPASGVIKTLDMNFSALIKNYFWIHLIVFSLSFVSIILTVKYVYTNVKIYWHLKKKYKNLFKDVNRTSNPNEIKQKPKWELLSSQDKQQFFNMWNIVALVGNLIQFFGAGLSLIYQEDNLVVIRELLIGSGCFCAFLGMGRYLEYLKDYSTIFSTIETALPNILRYFFGVLPIFLGFIFFGVALFWRSERFCNIPMAIISLFAMMNGDSVLDIINDLKGVNFFIGQLYAFTFGILFISIVMNIFVSIIEEAYVSSKMTNQNHWIFNFLKLDNGKDNGQDKNGEDKDKNKDKNVQLVDLAKEKRRIDMNVRSQNILLEAIYTEMAMDDSEGEKWQVVDLPKKPKPKQPRAQVMYTTRINHALVEVENIAGDIIRSAQNRMKDELKLFLIDHLTQLQGKIKELEEKNNNNHHKKKL